VKTPVAGNVSEYLQYGHGNASIQEIERKKAREMIGINCWQKLERAFAGCKHEPGCWDLETAEC